MFLFMTNPYFFSVTCAEITEDSSMLAVGFSDSIVKVWTLVPQKLKSMKTAEQLQDVNVDAEDVLVRIKFLFVAVPNGTLYN
jgi:hypothetical protein